jgi:hypothetical protein
VLESFVGCLRDGVTSLSVRICSFASQGRSDSLLPRRAASFSLVQKRDARRDGFAQVIRKAAQERLGEDAEEVLGVLAQQGIGRGLATQAVENCCPARAVHDLQPRRCRDSLDSKGPVDRGSG